MYGIIINLSVPVDFNEQALPEDVNHETGLEKVIGQVATFKMPTAATGKGVYELKVDCKIIFILLLPQFWVQIDLITYSKYFPRAMPYYWQCCGSRSVLDHPADPDPARKTSPNDLTHSSYADQDPAFQTSAHLDPDFCCS
jgi:hypothetical protein